MDPRRQLRRLMAAGAVAFLSIALGATEAFGLFQSSPAASTAVSSNAIVLATPAVNLSCNGNGKAKLSVTWTAPSMSTTTGSTTGFLNAYTVSITVDGTLKQSGTTSQTTYTDNSVAATANRAHSVTVTAAVTSSTSWSAAASQSATVSNC